MSPDQDPTLTLFTLHGLAVSLRDRADTHTERAEALLLGVERAFAQQMRGEPIDLGELIALAEAAAAESDTSRRLAEKALRGVRAGRSRFRCQRIHWRILRIEHPSCRRIHLRAPRRFPAI